METSPNNHTILNRSYQLKILSIFGGQYAGGLYKMYLIRWSQNYYVDKPFANDDCFLLLMLTQNYSLTFIQIKVKLL